MLSADHDLSQCLGTFLRNRRERLSPAEVGMPDGGRRRTPGLRREEVATLAGISIDYLVRLEQGRELRPSSSVREALGRALRLGEDERAHVDQLVTMAGVTIGELGPLPVPEVSRTTRALLDRMGATPAFVIDGATDVLAGNRAFQRLMEPVGLFGGDPPNLLRYMFLDPAARSLYPDWEDVAWGKVAVLQASVVQRAGDARLVGLVEELLTGSADFTRMWTSRDVAGKRRGAFRMRHPMAGELVLEHETLALPDPEPLQLVAYVPADESSEEALDDLVSVSEALAGDVGTSRAARLRLVREGA